jgi:aryl-alcohol dehydrogenase-like predicted oxidoreductase
MTSLDHYRLLGRSGLRVSPLSLGTMTFGKDWGWGADATEARRIYDLYVDRGGNFVDTSVNYTDGASERLLGEFIRDKRDRLVLATKFTMAREPGNPNAGGNHRLNLLRSVEQSLRQLGTDRIDLLYLHAWDFTTQPEEVMRALDDLVRAGKIVYAGICNTPAWRIAQLQTLADLRGWSPFVALQIEYSLVERTVEHELMPMAQALGLGVLPWSPLGGGILTGKYSRSDLSDEKRSPRFSDQEGRHRVDRPSQRTLYQHRGSRRHGRQGTERIAVPGGARVDTASSRGCLANHGGSNAGAGAGQSRRIGYFIRRRADRSIEPGERIAADLPPALYRSSDGPTAHLRRVQCERSKVRQWSAGGSSAARLSADDSPVPA